METKKPKVKLVGEDGNAFLIIGKVCNALRKAGCSPEHIKEYQKKVMRGDYNNLLVVTMEYVDIE
jgi:hypothetical protein